MAPLTKTCPKMVLSHKGGSLCVKDVFAKKFFGAGRDSAGGALASVLRKHSTEGRTPDAVERCVRHCARSHPPRETGTCRPDSKRVERIASGSVATPISLVGHLLDPVHGFEPLADVLGITIELSIGCALWRAGRRSRSLARWKLSPA